MTPERWKQVEEVFQTALDLPPGERPAFIVEACAGDEELQAQVEALVAQFEEAGDFIEEPAVAVTGLREAIKSAETTPMTGGFEDPSLGRRIGAYRIARELGRGGMGAVYLAERADSEFRRSVAIKLIKRGMDTDFILRRFRNERQILATLDHPYIARLLDGGTTDDGLPYFVMEYIEGLPVYRFCDERKLTIQERLRLFRNVCAAVHYAHRQLVIHRDIKPSNILVTAEGVPKLLDFGIAKLLNPELAGEITLDPTATAMRLMTPEYAAPEQVQGLPVTPATDVYALGVLLYELLTGHRPYRLRHRSPQEMARVVCEQEPAVPSARVTSPEDLLPAHPSDTDPDTLNYLYWSRGATAESLRRELEGALDQVVMKALRKEPLERYHSAEELREDITRHLEGRAVSAPPVSVSVAAPSQRARAAAVPEAPTDEQSIAILPLKVLDARRDAETGDEYLGVGLADALITRLSALRRFALRPTSSVLRFGAPDTDPLDAGRELGVGYVLDGRIRRAGERIRVNVQLLDVRAGSAVWAGQFDQKFTDVLGLEDAISEQVAEALVPRLTGGERLRLQKRGTDNAEAHEAYLRGRYHWNTFTEEGLAKALTHYHEAVALDPNYALAYAGIADYFNWLGVYSVLPFAETSAAAKEAALQAVGLDPALAEGHSALGFARLTHDFDWRPSEEDHRRALDLNPNYATGRVWYSYQLMMEGRFDEALAEVRRALELDPLSAINVHTLTWCHYNRRRLDESIAHARKLVDSEPQNGIGHLFLGHVLAMSGEREESISESLKAVEIFNRSPYSLSWLAMNYARAGRREEAREVLREVEGLAAHRYVSPYLLALAYCNLGERERALDLLEQALAMRDAWLVWLGVEPQLDPLRPDPRFAELLRRTNNPAAARPTPIVAARAQTPSQRSVAVLPLKLISGRHARDTGEEYLGVGLADALVTRLSNLRQIAVRPTSSVLRYQGRDVDPASAGRELDADYVITGTVRVAGERIRVSAQLLSVAEGATRWAGKFDESSADVLQLEDSISEQVVGALIPHLTGDERRQLEKRGTDNAEAFESYLRGRYHWNTFTTEGFARSLFFYRRAIEIDPDYALAYAGLADYHLWRSVFGYGESTPAESAGEARAAALRAIELNDTLAEAHATLCTIALIHDYDRAGAERHERRSLELNPQSGMAHVWRSTRLMMEGLIDEGVEAARRALELDPYTPFVQQHLGWTLYQARRFDESVAQYQRFIESDPRDGFVRCCLSYPLRQQKLHAEALSEARRGAELTGDSTFVQAGLGAALACAGLTREAHEVLGRLREGAQYVSPYHLATLHVTLGEHEEALAELERAVGARDGWAIWLGTDPQFDTLREDPRFDELLLRTNHPAAKGRPRGAAIAAAGERRMGGSRAGEKSVAVLPLKVLGHAASADGREDEYLGVGLADALITRLSNVHRLVVRPTSSVLRYQDGEADPLAAGRDLGVEYVIDGHLRRVGERIRVTAQLLDVREGATRWAGQFDESAADVLQLEDSLSEQVAAAIIPQLTTEERRRLGKRGTDNPEAYESYLRGRYHWNSFTEEGFAKALVCYNRAIAVDPDYALAHAGVADYYNLLGIYSVLPFAETSAAAKEAALKAAALDPALAEAYAALGFATLCHDFDWEASERHMHRAIELSPNYPTGHLWYGYALGLAGRHDEALAHMRRYRELDPLTPVGYNALSWAHFYARRFDESVAAGRDLSQREPRYGMGQVFFCLILTQTRRYDEAVEAGLRAVELLGRSPYTLSWLASAHAAAGHRDQATALLAEIHQLGATRYVSPYLLAMVYCNLGERERALELLEQALAMRDGRLAWLGVDPQFDSLRSEPRVGELLRRTNHPLAPPRPAPSTLAVAPTAAAPFAPERRTGDRTTGDLSTGAKSVAVLPLKVLGPPGGADTGDEYLGVGLADALVTRLSSVQRLVVRPTSSVLRYRRDDADPLEAGRELNVDYVVDGNIRRIGERIRVTAQLLDVREGATRWAGRFDKDSADVLQLEDSISELVAEALVPRLTGDERLQLERRGTDNPEAYEAYLRGRFHWNIFTEEAFASALEYYNRAVQLDPAYALAHAAIADYYNFVGVLCMMPFDEAVAAARASALRALELDPTLAEAYSALGLASVCYDFDWAGSEANHLRSVELNPNNATGHQWYSFYLQMAGRFEEAVAEMRRAQEIDPLSSLIMHSLAWCLYHARRFDESLAAYRNLVKAVPNYPYGLVTYSEALRHVGRHDEAVAAAQRAVDLTGGAPFYLTFLAAALAAGGRAAEARAALRRLEEMSRSGRYVSPYMLAFVHVRLGERERAFELLERAYEIVDGWLVWMGVDPELDPLRGDPRFDSLLRRTKNPAAPKLVERAAATGGRRLDSSAQDAPAPQAPRPRMTEDDEAQQLYVAGRYYSTRRTAEGLRQAIERFERAVERDPRFALAHAELADCYALLNWYVEPPPPDAWEQARLSALRAVAADDSLAEAHASLGFVKLHYERDWPGAETELRRAIELKPDNPAARRWYAFSLSAMGRHDEAVAEIEQARELSPRSPVIATAVANVLFLARRFDEAIEQCRRALELDPGSVAAHVVLRWSYECNGLPEEALATFDEERVFAGDTPTTRAKRAHVLAATGRREEARAILSDLLANRDEQRVTHYELAVICSLLDERDEAFRFLAEAEREHAVGFTFVRVDPHLDNLRDDPRFIALLERTGNLAPAADPASPAPDGRRDSAG